MKLLGIGIVPVVLAYCVFVVSALTAKLSENETVSASDTGPGSALKKVLGMIEDLSVKVEEERKREEQENVDYEAYCEDTAASAGRAAAFAKTKKAKADALIAEQSSDLAQIQASIDIITKSIATSQRELDQKSEQRDLEQKNFVATEKELEDAIDSIDSAISVIGAEMQKNPTALAQVNKKTLKSLLSTFGTIVDGTSMSMHNKDKMKSLIQMNAKSEEEEEEEEDQAFADQLMGNQPAYKSRSDSLFAMLEDMKDKAEDQLNDLQKDEVMAMNKFGLLKLSLQNQIEDDTRDLNADKIKKARAGDIMAKAQGELSKAEADLAANDKILFELKSDCAEWRSNHAKFLRDNSAEKKALSHAAQAIHNAMNTDALKSAAAADLQEEANPFSFIQSHKEANPVSFLQSHSNHKNFIKAKVVAMVKALAKKNHASALAQLASRMKSMLRYGSDGAFDNVKELIEEMIGKLERAINKDTKESDFCEMELSSTKEKMADLEEELAKLTSDLEVSTARSVSLQRQRAEASKALTDNIKETKDAGDVYRTVTADHKVLQDDQTNALKGISEAIAVLTKIYGSPSAAEASSVLQISSSSNNSLKNSAPGSTKDSGKGIIVLLGLIKENIANAISAEDKRYADIKAGYEKEMHDMGIMRVKLEKDANFYEGEYAKQARAAAEISEDIDTKKQEKQTLVWYFEKLKDRCIAKPSTFKEREQRRADEIDGLKEALRILDQETALMETEVKAKTLRGAYHHKD